MLRAIGINPYTEFQSSLDHIICRVPPCCIILNKYKLFKPMVSKAIADWGSKKLFAALRSVSNKYNNVVKFFQWSFFTPCCKLFLLIT